MITLVLVGLVSVLFYMLWRTEGQAKPMDQDRPSGKVPIWLLLGILSIVALLSPKIRDKINEIKQKHHL